MKSIKSIFSVAGGSVVGGAHIRAGKNNHDAYYMNTSDDYLVGLVADGCSGGKHSEVGAKLAVQFLGAQLSKVALQIVLKFQEKDIPADYMTAQLTSASHKVLSQLSVLMQAMGGSYSKMVNEYLLFTLIGYIVTPKDTYIIGLGDGVYAINGIVRQLGPFPNNAPPYLAYDLTGSTLIDGPFELDIIDTAPTESLDSLLIGTDGISDLIAVQDKSLPKRSNESVGGLSQFWEDKSFFANPDKVRRRLAMINAITINHSSIFKPLIVYGLLRDDTTLITVKRNIST